MLHGVIHWLLAVMPNPGAVEPAVATFFSEWAKPWLRSSLSPGAIQTVAIVLAVIAVGALLNLTAVLANGGYMPSSPDVWLELTGAAALPVSYYSNVVLIGPDTLLPFLGDIFLFPKPLPMATAFSIGDAVIAVGALAFLISAMRQPSSSPLRLPVSPPRPVQP